VRETPTNSSAIHYLQTDALIRNDSFATGLKKCSKTSSLLYVVEKATRELQSWQFSAFLAYLLQEPVCGVMGTPLALLALQGA